VIKTEKTNKNINQDNQSMSPDSKPELSKYGRRW
jgi:hypothetical protein